MKAVRFVFTATVLAILSILLLAGIITLYGVIEDTAPADVAVVLGNAVYADGTPAPRLAARLDRAYELYRECVTDKIIVSGGVGYSRYDESIAMRDYLIDRGIPPKDIIVDGNGVNTRATAQFTAEYMKERGMTRAIVVSQFFHIARSAMTMHDEGISDVGSAFARFLEWRDVFSLMREMPAYVAYKLGIK